MYQQLIRDFVRQEQLPDSYAADANNWFVPLISHIENQLSSASNLPILIGINGAQGTGKSTLAKLITALLTEKGHNVANLSIDDFYLSKAKRQQLATEVHPLLVSRGVPGTHDTNQALRTIQALKTASDSDTVILPKFDKSIDDCCTEESWPSVKGSVNVIILEGWFVGARPQDSAELETPINPLESNEDSDGQWRHFVNQQLEAHYQIMFSQLDLLIMLKAPAFEQVYEWRKLQEQKLRKQAGDAATGLMNDTEITRFIQHFERLTRHCLKHLEDKADLVFHLDKNHKVSSQTRRA